MSTRQLERFRAPRSGFEDGALPPPRSGPLRSLKRRAVGLWQRLDRPDDSCVAEFDGGRSELGLRRALVRPAIVGFVANALIFAGATQPDSPFTLKSVTGAWFFGIPAPSPVQGITPPPGQGLFLGVIAVYGGMALLVRAWIDVCRVTSRHPGSPVRSYVPVFLAWVAPLLVVAPLFSRDVYSYAAQGEMMAHAINPYHYGPGLLGATPFTALVDPLWQNVSSPYGPAFLGIAGLVVEAVRHNNLLAVEGMRIVALAGTALFAAAVPSLARSYGRDGASAFALVALNPLVLLHLVAGAHNDALMIGLLVVGLALARRGHPIAGILCCAMGAEVKVPALLGVLYIGWEWLGEKKSPHERLRPVATAFLIALGAMAALSEVVGLGWGWIGGLTNPESVRSWLDPATGIALLLGRIGEGIGLGVHTPALITVARGLGFLVGAIVIVVLLWRAEQMGPLRALGWSLIILVMTGPVVQPWYLTWGFVVLAPVAERRDRRILIVASVVSCFLGLPGGRVLWNELELANPAILGLSSVALVALLGVLVGPRLHRRWLTRGVEPLPESFPVSLP